MALEHIVAALEKAVEAEIAELETQAAAEVEEILAGAAAQARSLRAGQLAAIQPRIQAEKSRRINKARLDAQHIRLEMRRELIAAVLDAAEVQLAQIRLRPDYDLILAALVREVLDALGDAARFEIDGRDSQPVRLILDRVGGDNAASIAVDDTLQSWGGVIGHSADGRVAVDNTLEARFSHIKERSWGDIAGLLEGEEIDGG